MHKSQKVNEKYLGQSQILRKNGFFFELFGGAFLQRNVYILKSSENISIFDSLHDLSLCLRDTVYTYVETLFLRSVWLQFVLEMFVLELITWST